MATPSLVRGRAKCPPCRPSPLLHSHPPPPPRIAPAEQGWGVKGGLGWASLLADAYRRRADVVNRGFGGYTTRTLGPVLRRACAAARASGTRFAFTTLFLGANDSNADPAQGVPLPEFGARLRAMLAELAGVADCVLVVGPPPVDNRRWPTRSNAAAAAFGDEAEAAVREVAGARGGGGCTLLFASLYGALAGTRAPIPEGAATPLSLASTPALAWLDALSDGLHLSSNGNVALAALVLGAVRAGCPGAAPEGLGDDFPHWSAAEADT